MGSYNIHKMQKKLKKYIDEARYMHTLGVMYTAASLAMCYGEDLARAQVAGLLHDSAKCIPNPKKLKLCRQHGIPITEAEQRAPYLLHAKLGAYIAREKYHIQDPEILSAIECHTTGKPDMTLLEKIIFISDYIEPLRSKAANLAEIRELAFHDLDKAVYRTMQDTLHYLKEENASLDDQTVVAYQYYEEIIRKREES